MSYNIINEYGDIAIKDYEKVICSIIEQAIQYVDCPFECEINIILTNNDTIKDINNEQRNIDNATDVLSFPLIDYTFPADFQNICENDAEYFNIQTGELLLGDIVISVDKVYEQAIAYNHSNTRELAFLVAHSMLHLFGFDHIDDNERIDMEKKQEEILTMKGYTRDYEEI